MFLINLFFTKSFTLYILFTVLYSCVVQKTPPMYTYHSVDLKTRDLILSTCICWCGLENLAVINLDSIRASNSDDYSKLAYLVRAQYYSLHLNKKISPKMILILSFKFESDIFTILAFSSCRICNTMYSQHFT